MHTIRARVSFAKKSFASNFHSSLMTSGLEIECFAGTQTFCCMSRYLFSISGDLHSGIFSFKILLITNSKELLYMLDVT